jgi:hypothetical protein
LLKPAVVAQASACAPRPNITTLPLNALLFLPGVSKNLEQPFEPYRIGNYIYYLAIWLGAIMLSAVRSGVTAYPVDAAPASFSILSLRRFAEIRNGVTMKL